jgi:hypothetical protein
MNLKEFYDGSSTLLEIEKTTLCAGGRNLPALLSKNFPAEGYLPGMRRRG